MSEANKEFDRPIVTLVPLPGVESSGAYEEVFGAIVGWVWLIAMLAKAVLG